MQQTSNAEKCLRAGEESGPRQKAGKFDVRSHGNALLYEGVVKYPSDVTPSVSRGVHCVKCFHQKTWLVKLTIRVDEDLHRRLAVVAAASGESINACITSLLERETTRVFKDHGLAG
jgi:predicted HicB family RNase H-like nuclease